MTRSRLDETAENEEMNKVASPKTVGDLLPGFDHDIDGVAAHTLSIGHLHDLVALGIEAEKLTAIKKATYGISAKDNSAEYEAAKKRGEAAALKAFSDGLLPSSVPSENELTVKHAVEYIASYRDAECDRSDDPAAHLVSWYQKRMNEEEKAELSKPRNQARANCVKRIAAEWLNKDRAALGEKQAAARDVVIAKGKEAYGAKLTNARAAVHSRTAALLSPYNPAKPIETKTKTAPVEVLDDPGF